MSKLTGFQSAIKSAGRNSGPGTGQGGKKPSNLQPVMPGTHKVEIPAPDKLGENASFFKAVKGESNGIVPGRGQVFERFKGNQMEGKKLAAPGKLPTPAEVAKPEHTGQKGSILEIPEGTFKRNKGIFSGTGTVTPTQGNIASGRAPPPKANAQNPVNSLEAAAKTTEQPAPNKTARASEANAQKALGKLANLDAVLANAGKQVKLVENTGGIPPPPPMPKALNAGPHPLKPKPEEVNTLRKAIKKGANEMAAKKRLEKELSANANSRAKLPSGEIIAPESTITPQQTQPSFTIPPFKGIKKHPIGESQNNSGLPKKPDSTTSNLIEGLNLAKAKAKVFTKKNVPPVAEPEVKETLEVAPATASKKMRYNAALERYVENTGTELPTITANIAAIKRESTLPPSESETKPAINQSVQSYRNTVLNAAKTPTNNALAKVKQNLPDLTTEQIKEMRAKIEVPLELAQYTAIIKEGNTRPEVLEQILAGNNPKGDFEALIKLQDAGFDLTRLTSADEIELRIKLLSSNGSNGNNYLTILPKNNQPPPPPPPPPPSNQKIDYAAQPPSGKEIAYKKLPGPGGNNSNSGKQLPPRPSRGTMSTYPSSGQSPPPKQSNTVIAEFAKLGNIDYSEAMRLSAKKNRAEYRLKKATKKALKKEKLAKKRLPYSFVKDILGISVKDSVFGKYSNLFKIKPNQTREELQQQVNEIQNALQTEQKKVENNRAEAGKTQGIDQQKLISKAVESQKLFKNALEKLKSPNAINKMFSNSEELGKLEAKTFLNTTVNNSQAGGKSHMTRKLLQKCTTRKIKQKTKRHKQTKPNPNKKTRKTLLASNNNHRHHHN